MQNFDWNKVLGTGAAQDGAKTPEAQPVTGGGTGDEMPVIRPAELPPIVSSERPIMPEPSPELSELLKSIGAEAPAQAPSSVSPEISVDGAGSSSATTAHGTYESALEAEVDAGDAAEATTVEASTTNDPAGQISTPAGLLNPASVFAMPPVVASEPTPSDDPAEDAPGNETASINALAEESQPTEVTASSSMDSLTGVFPTNVEVTVPPLAEAIASEPAESSKFEDALQSGPVANEERPPREIPDTPPMSLNPAPVEDDELPFAAAERLLEEAAKSGVAPKLNPYAIKDPDEVIAQEHDQQETEPLSPEAVLSNVDTSRPPIENTGSEVASGPPPQALNTMPVDMPPVVAPPNMDPEKDRLLQMFNKKVDLPPPVQSDVSISELNTADKNLTRFDAHTADQSKITKYDGGTPITDIHIDEVLKMAVDRKCSDIHLTVGLPPMIRVDGEMQPLPFAPMQPADVRRLMYDTLDDEKLQKFESTKELDFSYPVRDVGRFRVNMFVQRGSVAAVMRVIPKRIPAFDELGLPPVIREMSKRTSGMILVTGPTGSGKSTTIASMIDDINGTRKGHIMTIEDPIEYLHVHKQSVVNQREMHADTYSFHNALRAVLREDPDIILVGELRDLETIEAALTLAETGHLVFGTLHTRNAPSTIDRIIDVFPPDSQEQIRVLLSNTLEGVVSQQLLPKLGGGRCAAIEIMMGTPAIRNLIREGKTHQMQSIIETSGNMGMQTMDACLAELYKSGLVEYEECLMRAIDRDNFGRIARNAA